MTLSIVGLGPGGPEHRTAAAERAVREADVVIGYGPYVDQCADLLDGQEVVRGRMGEETARAAEAVERARAGARVALVSSGDAGVHGMAARTLALAAAGAPGSPWRGRHGWRRRRGWRGRAARRGHPRRHRGACRRRAGRGAARGRLGDALALGSPPPVGDDRAAAHCTRRIGHRARALQPAVAHPHRAVRARAHDPSRAPRAGHARDRRHRRRSRRPRRSSRRRSRSSTRRA